MNNTRKLKAGLVGLHFGKFIIDRFLLDGEAGRYFSLHAICDLDPILVDSLSAEYDCRGYFTLGEMLEDSEIEVVILITPPEGRATLIRQIIRSGRDVITTKPFETDPEQASAVLREARDLGRFIYLNSPCATKSQDWKTIDKWRKEKNLGRPVAAHFEAWHKTVEGSDGSWYDDPEYCFVAPLLRLGIYGINDLVPLFGQPESIQVLESRIFTGRPTPDLSRVQMKFPDGSLVQLMNGFTMQPSRSEDSMILYFENGTIYRNPPLSVSNYPSGMTYLCLVTPECMDGVPWEVVRLPNAHCSRAYQWEVFYNAMSTRKRPTEEIPDETIIEGVRLLRSIKESAAAGRVDLLDNKLSGSGI